MICIILLSIITILAAKTKKHIGDEVSSIEKHHLQSKSKLLARAYSGLQMLFFTESFKDEIFNKPNQNDQKTSPRTFVKRTGSEDNRVRTDMAITIRKFILSEKSFMQRYYFFKPLSFCYSSHNYYKKPFLNSKTDSFYRYKFTMLSVSEECILETKTGSVVLENPRKKKSSLAAQSICVLLKIQSYVDHPFSQFDRIYKYDEDDFEVVGAVARRGRLFDSNFIKKYIAIVKNKKTKEFYKIGNKPEPELVKDNLLVKYHEVWLILAPKTK